ncbi:hypothetical protein D3C76_1331970 [compost metagenome]
MSSNQECNNLITDVLIIQCFSRFRVFAVEHVGQQIVCPFLRFLFTLGNNVIHQGEHGTDILFKLFLFGDHQLVLQTQSLQ